MKKYYLLLILLVNFSFSQAQIAIIPDTDFENVLLNNALVDVDGDGVIDGNADINNDGVLQISELSIIKGLTISNKTISSLEGIHYFTNLEVLRCNSNYLTSIDLSQNINLIELICGQHLLINLNLSQNTALKILNAAGSQLSDIDLTQNTELETLWLDYNSFTNLNLTENVNLIDLRFSYNQLTSFDISQNTNLEIVYCVENLITSIDISQNNSLKELACSDNQLSSLFIKNGSELEFLHFANNPNLAYICADDIEMISVQTKLDNSGYLNCVLNSYCSFVPGGRYYEINGETILDSNNDGCDLSDPVFPNLKFNLTNGVISGSIIANETGSFNLPVSSGNHTITPQLENPTYFAVSPTSIVVDFPTDTSPYAQDFCVTPNGVFNNLEISILPVTQARPGFDTDYKLVYKNKGNTILSGSIDFTFNDDLMDFVSTSPTADVQTIGSLTWNYTNLQPFETGSIDLTMNINAPTDPTFPVLGDDVLHFTATINPVSGDETPADNVFELPQTVVNSYDPNDKTCLEGKTIAPSEVGEYVHYMIRFENTGSASAVNIVVKDIIDVAKYDVSSLMPLHGSHSYVTRVRDTNIVEFIFENINLPFDDANNDGYVAFKIKTQPTLVVNDTFENNAEIYFDYNAPIITNVAQTTVAILGLADLVSDESLGMYPNPGSDFIYIKGKNNLKDISVYDLNGRVLNSISVIGNQLEKKLDITKLTQGVYFVRVLSSKGQFVSKLIKE